MQIQRVTHPHCPVQISSSAMMIPQQTYPHLRPPLQEVLDTVSNVKSTCILEGMQTWSGKTIPASLTQGRHFITYCT